MSALSIGDEIELIDGSKVQVVGYPIATVTLRTADGQVIVRCLDDPARAPDPNRLLLSNGKQLLLTTDSDLTGAYVVMKMENQVGFPSAKKMQVDALDDFRPMYGQMMAWLNEKGALN